MTKEDLKTMQEWSLERKIRVTQTRIMEWYMHYEGKVYVSFSGGKDSTVLLDLARRIYPDIPAVFVDTGLEYPSIRSFVKSKENITWLRPEMSFKKVIENYGYPVISKDVSKIVYGARHGLSERTRQNYLNRFDGLNPDGTHSDYKQMYKKYKYLLDAPFEMSNRCCLIMKETPLRKYERETGNKGIVATMAEESKQRRDGWLKTGCNAFDANVPLSKPMSFWTNQDILTYLKQFNIDFAGDYGEIIEENGKLKTTGLDRTGCMFCMFGVHLEKEPNRFQRMKENYPKQYDFCIRPVEQNGLGEGMVMDYIGVKYD